MSLKGAFNVTRRAKRSYETHHRDKRRQNVDRLAIFEARHNPPAKPTGFRAFLSAIGGLLKRKG